MATYVRSLDSILKQNKELEQKVEQIENKLLEEIKNSELIGQEREKLVARVEELSTANKKAKAGSTGIGGQIGVLPVTNTVQLTPNSYSNQLPTSSISNQLGSDVWLSRIIIPTIYNPLTLMEILDCPSHLQFYQTRLTIQIICPLLQTSDRSTLE
ncbi:MAG: hypothetical protein U0905_13685 [Pirellulales bacterium]